MHEHVGAGVWLLYIYSSEQKVAYNWLLNNICAFLFDFQYVFPNDSVNATEKLNGVLGFS